MKKRFLALFIVVVMLLSQVTIFATDLDISSASENPEDKLTDELKEVMSNTPNGEYIPIEITINTLDDSVVYKILSQRLGETITADTEEQIIKEQIETKIEQYNSYVKSINDSQISVMNANSQVKSIGVQTIRDVCEISSVMTNEELTSCINEGMSIGEIIELSERNQFLFDWRSTRKELNTAINNEFVAKLNSNNYTNLYIDPALTRLTVNCKKEYIISIASLGETERIGFFVDEIETTVEDTLTTTKNSFVQYHMTEYTDLDYDGTGVKVGILEAHDGTKSYDTNNVHLRDKVISYRGTSYDSSTNIISSHATTVLSIIGGDVVTSSSGIKYSGIAPNATLSLAYVKGYSDFSDALDWFVNEQNVHVINYSGGSGTGYEAKCFLFDNYIQQYRVTFVNSSGNKNNVTGPGTTYNGITVGNVGKLLNTGNYALLDGSAFNENNNFTNKPDICAIGTNIYMLNTSYNPEDRGYGTSYSAPQVTGAIALMLQKNSSLIGNPHKVKAILLSSADESAIYKEDDDPITILNPTIDTRYVSFATGINREKTGSGLLDIDTTLANINNPMLFTKSYSSISNSTVATAHGYYYFNANQTIKFCGLYEIDSDAFINSNKDNDEEGTLEDWQELGIDCNASMNIRIVSIDGTVVFDSNSMSSSSWTDNVKLFSVTFGTSDYYKFESYFTTKEGVSILNGFASNIVSAMMITCGCDNPNVTKSKIPYEINNIISCANCTYECEELKEGAVHEETNIYGTTTFIMQYDYDNIFNPTNICCSNFYIEFVPDDSSKLVSIIPEKVEKTHTPMGYSEYRKYMIVLYGNGSASTMFYVDVTIEYDSFALTYYLYG